MEPVMENTNITRDGSQRFGDRELGGMIQSEIEGGVFLNELPRHTILQIQTANRCYVAEVLGHSEIMICGHPRYCPEPVRVSVAGSNWGGAMLKLNFVGRGMRLEFNHPDFDDPIVTSPISEIREWGRISAWAD